MKKGMTLIEILVASVLLAIAISTSMYLYTQNSKTVIHNDRMFIATKIVKGYFEQISIAQTRNYVLEIINNSQKVITMKSSNGSSYTYNLSFTTKEIFVDENNSQPIQPTLLEVTGIVTWNDIDVGNIKLTTLVK